MIDMKLVSRGDSTEQEGKRVSGSEEEKSWGEESFGGVSLERAWCSELKVEGQVYRERKSIHLVGKATWVFQDAVPGPVKFQHSKA